MDNWCLAGHRMVKPCLTADSVDNMDGIPDVPQRFAKHRKPLIEQPTLWTGIHFIHFKSRGFSAVAN